MLTKHWRVHGYGRRPIKWPTTLHEKKFIQTCNRVNVFFKQAIVSGWYRPRGPCKTVLDGFSHAKVVYVIVMKALFRTRYKKVINYTLPGLDTSAVSHVNCGQRPARRRSHSTLTGNVKDLEGDGVTSEMLTRS